MREFGFLVVKVLITLVVQLGFVLIWLGCLIVWVCLFEFFYINVYVCPFVTIWVHIHASVSG